MCRLVRERDFNHRHEPTPPRALCSSTSLIAFGRSQSIDWNQSYMFRQNETESHILPYLTGFEYMHTVYIYITYMSHLIGIRNRELPGEVFSIAILDLDVAGLSVSFCWIFAVMWQPILIIYLSSFIDRDATRDFWVIIYFVHFQLTTHHLSYFTIQLAYIFPVSAYICCRPSIVFGYVAKTYAVTSSTWRITSDNRALGALACRRRRYNLGENRTNRWTHNLITPKASPVNPHTIVWMYIYIHVDGSIYTWYVVGVVRVSGLSANWWSDLYPLCQIHSLSVLRSHKTTASAYLTTSFVIYIYVRKVIVRCWMICTIRTTMFTLLGQCGHRRQQAWAIRGVVRVMPIPSSEYRLLSKYVLGRCNHHIRTHNADVSMRQLTHFV